MRKTNLGEDGLEGSSVIGSSITLSTVVLDTGELADSVVRVLRVHLADDFARAIEQYGGLVGRMDVALSESCGRACACEHISLTP